MSYGLKRQTTSSQCQADISRVWQSRLARNVTLLTGATVLAVFIATVCFFSSCVFTCTSTFCRQREREGCTRKKDWKEAQ